MRADGSKLTGRIKAVVVIEVRHAEPLISPAYDDGTTTEADILETHRAGFAGLHERRTQLRRPVDQVALDYIGQ